MKFVWNKNIKYKKKKIWKFINSLIRKKLLYIYLSDFYHKNILINAYYIAYNNNTKILIVFICVIYITYIYTWKLVLEDIYILKFLREIKFKKKIGF